MYASVHCDREIDSIDPPVLTQHSFAEFQSDNLRFQHQCVIVLRFQTGQEMVGSRIGLRRGGLLNHGALLVGLAHVTIKSWDFSGALPDQAGLNEAGKKYEFRCHLNPITSTPFRWDRGRSDDLARHCLRP
jgi:hypothetical protein